MVGGDVSAAGELVVAVTVLGTVRRTAVRPAGARAGRAARGRRAGHAGPAAARRPGCASCAAGAPGADRWPGRYRRPVARLREGEVARRAGVHAMIDVSDGLALDLHRLADASGVGFGSTTCRWRPGRRSRRRWAAARTTSC